MNAVLAHQRCWIHSNREAAARCPGCSRFFCRECITEHNGRVLCAACLRASLQPAVSPDRQRGRLRAIKSAALSASALATAWAFFYLLSLALLQAPSAFHEATLWAQPYLDSQEP